MQFNVSDAQDGWLISAVLRKEASSVPLWAIKESLKKRDIRVDGVRIPGDIRVFAGQEIRVFFPKAALQTAQNKALPDPEIVFEDEHVLLINKPQGIPSQNEENPLAGDSALTRARADMLRSGQNADHLHLCHRLDVQTGGLLLLVKDDASYESARTAFSERSFRKFYTCRVKGCPAKLSARMLAYLRKNAEISRVAITDYPVKDALPIETAYRVIDGDEYALLEVELITGRTHQIRAHLAHIGYPILGDDKYGDRALNRTLSIRRQQLWATRLVFHADGELAYLNGREFTVACPFANQR